MNYCLEIGTVILKDSLEKDLIFESRIFIVRILCKDFLVENLKFLENWKITFWIQTCYLGKIGGKFNFWKII
jgi:hypothetical protein